MALSVRRPGVVAFGPPPREVRLAVLFWRARRGDNPPVGISVLIVDDHPSFRASARRLLEADGFEVVGDAQDGHTAIEAARRLAPDVVLLDIQLPDLDGFEVAERLAALEPRPSVVLTSSRSVADYGALTKRSTARGFIPKAELSGQALSDLLSTPER